MKGLNVMRITLWVTTCLLLAFNPLYGQDISLKTNISDINNKIVKQVRKDGLPASLGPNDSVLVINGFIDMGKFNYYKVVPSIDLVCCASFSPHGGSGGCTFDTAYQPQFKKSENDGFKIFIIFKDTATNKSCFNFFVNEKQLNLTIFPVVFTDPGNWQAWQAVKGTHYINPVKLFDSSN